MLEMIPMVTRSGGTRTSRKYFRFEFGRLVAVCSCCCVMSFLSIFVEQGKAFALN